MFVTIYLSQKLYRAVGELASQLTGFIGCYINLNQLISILFLNHEGGKGINVKERSWYDP
jgi:hypothetical protein